MPDLIKYGLRWSNPNPVAIELACIEKGGTWKGSKGQICGAGLAQHIKTFTALVWPWVKQHRWFDLLIEEFSRGGRVAVFGPSSSGKSFVASLFALVMYYARPDNTTVLISSTTREELELRAWGEVKKLHKRTKERCPGLPGVLTDSKQLISTDGKDVEGRDFRNGLIGRPTRKGNEWVGLGPMVGIKNENVIVIADECFPAGTMVKTPLGEKPIETIQAGDCVISALGATQVKAISKRGASLLVVVTSDDGRSFSCTPNHPILTQMGWIRACNLSQRHYMLSVYEAMSLLREVDPTDSEQRSLLHGLQERGIYLPQVRGTLQAEMSDKQANVLQPELCVSMAASESKTPSEVLLARKSTEDFPVKDSDAQGQTGDRLGCKGKNETLESDATRVREKETKSDTKADRMEASNSMRQRNWTDTCRTISPESFSRRIKQLLGQNWKAIWKWLSYSLQGGRCVSENQVGSGVRREFSSGDCSEGTGSQEGRSLKGSWVGSVEVQKRKGSCRNRCCSNRTTVYNLSVEGHPSYSVEGFLVHNCHLMPDGFLKALANLTSNPSCTALMLGNLNDLNTPLGEAAEPEKGWDSLMDSEVSRVFPTRWLGGRAIQLVGKDSPNCEYPEGVEPFAPLIGWRYIKQCEHDYGLDTPLYNMFAAGKIPRSSMENRVISKQLCERFHAFEPVVWGHEQITKLYGLDVSYTLEHGDRTAGIPLAFGYDVEGKYRLAALEKPKVFAPSDREEGSMEEQVAALLMAECKRLGIPASSVFFDGTGRSSFTSAVMRVWSTDVVALEFGGRASERDNFMGRRWMEGKDQGKLIPCNLVFGKFVTELWFAARSLIESDQCRGLSEEVAKEGYLRLWSLTAGNKIDVEPKKDMKLRLGRSPDLFDCFTGNTLVETPHGNVRIDCLSVGDYVVTPFGNTKIHSVHQEDVSETMKVVFSTGNHLEGKRKHKIFTWDQGWVRMDALSFDNEIESIYNQPIWKLANALFTKAESTGFKALVSTIKTKTKKVRLRDFYTELSGLSTAELFLTVCASITRMAIGRITTLITSKLCQLAITLACMSKNAISNIQNKRLNFGRQELSPLSIGTNLTKGEDGIPCMAKTLGLKEQPSPRFVRFAEANFSLTFQPKRCFAQRNATANIESPITDLIDCVRSVVRNLIATNTMLRRTVLVGVQQSQRQESKRVYNLTLVDHNAFYANGILVDNCFVAGIEGARQLGFPLGKADAQRTKKQEWWMKQASRQYDQMMKEKELVTS